MDDKPAGHGRDRCAEWRPRAEVRTREMCCHRSTGNQLLLDVSLSRVQKIKLRWISEASRRCTPRLSAPMARHRIKRQAQVDFWASLMGA